MSHPPSNRSRVVVSHLTDPSDDRQYWWQQAPEARLTALETMRQVLYGYDPTSGRLQRRLLNAHRVEYLLIDGYAVAYHGYPRATVDLPD